jgi:hypothetical protein
MGAGSNTFKPGTIKPGTNKPGTNSEGGAGKLESSGPGAAARTSHPRAKKHGRRRGPLLLVRSGCGPRGLAVLIDQQRLRITPNNGLIDNDLCNIIA